ncbi:asparagine synthase-related protein [Halapricum desulfuricans]|uniref:asparagine synthase-related protein n=1 Tax=Halapricum desulfuricans TaxID=2841257 RepID=UPI001E5D0176|nr:asparagine synthase C-terminal domain-containing protein [Halapricum desulfuricans]
MFGTRPTDTYVEEVGRLGHGEVLEWTTTDVPETELVETISVDETINGAEAKHRLDRHFTDVIGDAKFNGSVATMLSGGVDSTLIHTYLDNDATVSAAFDSPEFEFEIEYARRASDLLGSAHEVVLSDEENFLDHVETTIDATGQPLLLPQATLMHLAVSRSPHQIYLNGGLADGLFGTGTAALAYLARYAGRAARLVPNLTWQLEALKKTSEQLRRPASDPTGCAMNFRIHSDQNLVADMFGQTAVEERKNRRLRYTERRVDADDRKGYAAHMHLGHAIEYFHDNILTIWRHAAHDSGKAIQTPFSGRKVFETALAISPADRYARFAVPSRDQPTRVVQHKYLLKELLNERLPAYDTKKRKGYSLLPMQRYLDDGPLSNAFDEYPMPEFVPEHYRGVIREGTDEVSWYALNYAVWRDRILLNEDLDIIETTTVVGA